MPDRRYNAVVVVLVQVLVLNLAVAVAKIVLGFVTGAVSILSDGFHSLADSLSNVVGLVGVRIARKPPDRDHPYGHRKFETLAAGLIAGFLMLVMVEVLRTAVDRLRHPQPPQITSLTFGVLIVTLAINLIVATYERRKGRELSSEVLVADSTHTKSDVFTSLTVIAALAGMAAGIPLLDPIAAFIVVGFIGRAGVEIALSTSSILADHIVIGEDDSAAGGVERAWRPRRASHPDARVIGPCLPGSPRLADTRHAPRRCPRGVARGQGSD